MALSTNESPPKRPRPRPDGQPAGSAPLGQGQRQTVRVLLIEDDHVDIKLIHACAAAIKALQLDVEAVSSIAEAHERLAGQPFDLCITDYWLGHESSLRLIGAVQRLTRPLPVVVLTSLSTAEIQKLCLQAGAVDVLGKEQLSPGTLEGAVKAALRAAQRGAPPHHPPSGAAPAFFERFVQIMQGLEEAPCPGAASEPAQDARPARALIRAFAALSETARFGIFEQLVADRAHQDRPAWSSPRNSTADMVEAVELARSLIETRGHTISFTRPRTPVHLGCDEAALFFLVFELMNRVGEVTGGNGTVSVAVDDEVVSCALQVSGTAPSSIPGLPVTLGALFTRVLRACRGNVETVRSPGGGPILVMRFARHPDWIRPPTAH